MKRLLIVLLCIFVLSSCEKPPIDTSIYTADNPYIEEDIKLTGDESLSSLVSFGMGYTVVPLSKKINIMSEYEGLSVYIVTKKSSKSYYWEDGEKHIVYTDTKVEIKDKILGNGETYNNIKVGDKLNLMEYFSKSPTGEIWSSFTEARKTTVSFAMQTNRFESGFRDNSIHVLSSTINEMVYGTIDYITEMPPLLKFDTDYLLVIEELYCFEMEDKMLIDYIELDASQFIGKYVKYLAYELNQSAYDNALNDLQNYQAKNGEDRYKKYIRNSGVGHYNKMVVDAWETYGDRVTE